MSFKVEIEKKIIEVELNQQDGFRQVIPIEDIPYDLIIDKTKVEKIINDKIDLLSNTNKGIPEHNGAQLAILNILKKEFELSE